MTTIPEQFNAQLKFFNTVASTAVKGAEQLIALNLATSRTAFEHSSRTLQQMLQAGHAADLLALGAAGGRPEFERLFAYGRELFEIASATQASLLNSAVALPAKAQPVVRAAPAPAPAPVAVSVSAAPVVEVLAQPVAEVVAEPVVEVAAEPVAKPAAKTKAAAKAKAGAK